MATKSAEHMREKKRKMLRESHAQKVPVLQKPKPPVKAKKAPVEKFVPKLQLQETFTQTTGTIPKLRRPFAQNVKTWGMVQKLRIPFSKNAPAKKQKAAPATAPVTKPEEPSPVKKTNEPPAKNAPIEKQQAQETQKVTVPTNIWASEDERELITGSEEYKKLEPIFGQAISASLCRWGKKYNVEPYIIASIMVAENSGPNDPDPFSIISKNLKENPNHYANRISYVLVTDKKGRPIKDKHGNYKKREQAYGLLQITKTTFRELKRIARADTAAENNIQSVAASYGKSIRYASIYVASFRKRDNIKTNEKIAVAYNAGPYSFMIDNPNKENLTEKEERTKRDALDYIKKFNRAYEYITKGQTSTSTDSKK